MFQYDSGRSVQPPVAPIIKDLGRTKAQITEFFQQTARVPTFVWSSDGVEVAVDPRNQDTAAAMATTGDALTDNTILAAGRVRRQVTAELFNSLRVAGYFERPGSAGWTVGQVQRITANTPYLNIAVLSVPTHNFKTWGAVSTARRLTVLNTALRIAFTTWAADYRADSVYLFAAPEYYFGGTQTHFLADGDATAVTTALTECLQILPDNYLVIPGSVGRRRALIGRAAYDYYTGHLERHEALVDEMTDHELLKDEIEGQRFLWGYEPKMAQDNTQQTAYVYSNTATIFRGSTPSTTYSKRYESVPDGGAPDRTAEQNKDGYFDIGTTKFTTVVNGLTIRLEICADNSYESIKDSSYNGLHVLLASDFGRVETAAIHGQVYAHADSTSSSVCAQQTAGPVLNRTAAGERDLDDIASQRTATCTAGPRPASSPSTSADCHSGRRSEYDGPNDLIDLEEPYVRPLLDSVGRIWPCGRHKPSNLNVSGTYNVKVTASGPAMPFLATQFPALSAPGSRYPPLRSPASGLPGTSPPVPGP